MSVRPGTRLDGRYRLSERIAFGGMGEVWRGDRRGPAAARSPSRSCAPSSPRTRPSSARFRAEARTTAGCPTTASPPSTTTARPGSAPTGSPRPYDDADADPVAYLVMELVPGEALSAILSRDGALGSDRTLDLVAQAGRALHAAHQRGVIHRDIKPANLMVTPDGRVKVTDFGIARPLDHEPLTATGQVMGTAHYLAPELAKGHDASALLRRLRPRRRRLRVPGGPPARSRATTRSPSPWPTSTSSPPPLPASIPRAGAGRRRRRDGEGPPAPHAERGGLRRAPWRRCASRQTDPATSTLTPGTGPRRCSRGARSRWG